MDNQDLISESLKKFGEEITVEIRKFMTYFQENKDDLTSKPASPELQKKIANIKKGVDFFKALNQEIAKQSIQDSTNTPTALTLDDQKKILEFKKLRQELKQTKFIFTKAQEAFNGQTSEGTKKTKKRERYNKYKTLGGDSKWMPL